MAPTVDMKTWVPWSELTQTPRGTVAELRGLLNKYRPSSVLKGCSRLGILFGFGPDSGTTADQAATAQWIPVLLRKDLVAKALKLTKGGRILFFQAQLRYLAATVIQLSPMPAEDLPEVPNVTLGELVLRSGELLYKPHTVVADSLDAMANLAAEFLPVYEMDSPTDPAILLLRFYIFLTVNIPRLPSELRTFDVFALFEKQFDFSLKTYCEFIFLFLTHARLLREKKQLDAAMNSGLSLASFQNATVSQDLIHRMFDAVSFSLDKVEAPKEPFGYSDFEFLKDHPYLRYKDELFCLDYEFAVGKLESGALWRILKGLPSDKRLPYLSFWGNVFEDYVAWLFDTYAAKKLHSFYPAPRYINAQAHPICDAIVLCGSTAILIEAKMATCPAPIRYSANYKKMRKFLEDRLVSGTDRKVGVSQLLVAIDSLATHPAEQLPAWLRSVRKFIPLIITKDDLGSSWVVNGYLNARFKQQIDRKKYKEYTVTPLVSMSISSLERSVNAIRKVPFSQVLENRIAGDKLMQRPFEAASNYVPSGMPRNISAHMEVLSALMQDVIADFKITDPPGTTGS